MKGFKIFAALVLFSSFSIAAFGQDTVTRSMSLNPYAMYLELSASFGQGGIIMPQPTSVSSTRSAFSMGFTLPYDYAPDTPLQLKVLWQSDATSSCEINLGTSWLSWGQPGSIIISGDFVPPGRLSASGTPAMVSEALFGISHSQNSSFKPGDAITGSLFRKSTLDTCNNSTLFVLGLSVIYQGLREGVFADGFEH